MKYLFFFLLFTSVHVVSTAQSYTLKGIVVLEKDDSPLHDASVFISNGSIGTSSGKDGAFTLNSIPYSTFELVISYIGFETIVIPIDPTNINKRFVVKMVPKTNELEEVIVGGIEKDGWKKWGPTFIKYFIGTTANAGKCEIINPGVLMFRHNKTTGVLTVVARDKLVIKNSALGYIINFQMEDFFYDSRAQVITYTGYPFFENLISNGGRKSKKWNVARRAAYNGSMMHFIRSFYNKKTNDDGFELTYLIRISPKDSLLRPVYNRIMSRNYSDIDTAKFYIQLAKESTFSAPSIFAYLKKPLSPDSIHVHDSASARQGIFFNNIVQVRYKNELESLEYVQQQYPVRTRRLPQSSMFYFRVSQPIIIEKNGLFYPPLNVFMEGYWSFEKMAELLPSDYMEE